MVSNESIFSAEYQFGPVVRSSVIFETVNGVPFGKANIESRSKRQDRRAERWLIRDQQQRSTRLHPILYDSAFLSCECRSISITWPGGSINDHQNVVSLKYFFRKDCPVRRDPVAFVRDRFD